MNKKLRKLIACAAAFGVVLTSTITSAAAAPLAALSVADRLGGADRYETAAIIANRGWSSGSDYVIIARGDDFADALCAAPLAKMYKAPILLTKTDSLPDKTKSQIQVLKPKHIIIIGGNGAVSSAVEQSLKEIVSDVQRISGPSRYETSVEVAKKLGVNKKVVVATGENPADALSIAPIAAADGMPILLTQPDTLPASVLSYINDNKVSTSYVIGGTGAVSDSVKKLLPAAERIGGTDRYDTNVKVMDRFSNEFNFENVYVAVGNEFADALAASALAAQSSSPVVLTYDKISAATASFINSQITPQSQITAIGGTAVVSDEDIRSFKVDKQDYSEDNKTYSNVQINANVSITGKNVSFQNGKINGNVYIYGNGAKLTGTEVTGIVFVDPGENGDVTLDGVKAGKIKVLSGAESTLHIRSVSAGVLIIESDNPSVTVRVVCEGSTVILQTVVNSDVRLESNSGSLGDVDIRSSGRRGRGVGLRGTFNKPLRLSGGATLSAGSGASIAGVIVSAPLSAVIKLADGNFGDVVFDTPVNLQVASGVTANLKPSTQEAAKGTVVNVEKGANVTAPKDTGMVFIGEGKDQVKPPATQPPSSSGDSDPVVKGLVVTPTAADNNVSVAVASDTPADLGKPLTIFIKDKDASDKIVYFNQINNFTGSFTFNTILGDGHYKITVTTASASKTENLNISTHQQTGKTLTITKGTATISRHVDVSDNDTLSKAFDSNKGLFANVFTYFGSDRLNAKLANKTIGGTVINVYIANKLTAKNPNSKMAEILNDNGKVNFTKLGEYINGHSFADFSNSWVSKVGDITIDNAKVGDSSITGIKVNGNIIYDGNTDKTVSISELKKAFFTDSNVNLNQVKISEWLAKEIDVKVYSDANVIYSISGKNGEYKVETTAATYTISLK